MRLMPHIVKEWKMVDWRKTVATGALLFVMFAVSSIGQLGMLEKDFGMKEEGIPDLLHAINQEEAYRVKCTNMLMSIGFLIPVIVHCFYLGLPYLLHMYHREKNNKNMAFLLATPVRPFHLMTAAWLMSLLRVLILSGGTGVLLLAGFMLMGLRISVELPILFSAMAVHLAAGAFLLLANALIYGTNGREWVLKLMRAGVLIGIMLAFPAAIRLDIDFSILGMESLFISILFFLFCIGASIPLLRNFKPESALIS